MTTETIMIIFIAVNLVWLILSFIVIQILYKDLNDLHNKMNDHVRNSYKLNDSLWNNVLANQKFVNDLYDHILQMKNSDKV